MMLDLTVIILTFNEKLHIERCLKSVNQFADRVILIDCHSTDGTQDIARSLGAEVIEHDWPGNQAAQFNWALDNVEINSTWILRLDADEYLSDELIAELREKLPSIPDNVGGVVLPLGRAFLGRRLKHGIVNGISMVRLFRNGHGRYENRQMDEHLQIQGDCITFNHPFIDDNLMPLGFFIEKHNNYSIREAALLVMKEISMESEQGDYADVVKQKRKEKDGYAKLPLFWRSFAYFCYRYFFKLGFLDGKEGFLWDFFQGFWYRMLVDAKVYEIKKHCGTDTTKIKNYLAERYRFNFLN